MVPKLTVLSGLKIVFKCAGQITLLFFYYYIIAQTMQFELEVIKSQ